MDIALNKAVETLLSCVILNRIQKKGKSSDDLSSLQSYLSHIKYDMTSFVTSGAELVKCVAKLI